MHELAQDEEKSELAPSHRPLRGVRLGLVDGVHRVSEHPLTSFEMGDTKGEGCADLFTAMVTRIIFTSSPEAHPKGRVPPGALERDHEASFHLSSPKPGHTTGGSGRGARRV